MKRILLMVCWVCSLLTAVSQQKPHYTQYILNNYIINPALTGIENYADIKISHRHQWVGIQDAPVTTYPLSNYMQTSIRKYRSLPRMLFPT